MCNPGGAAALLRAKPAMTRLRAGATLAALEAAAGRELGVVRISLGLASDWADVWRVLEFVRDFVLDARGREEAMGDRMHARWRWLGLFGKSLLSLCVVK